MPDYVETNFDEKSGIVPYKAPWGRWWQTVAEVHAEVDIPAGTKSKFIQVTVKPSHIKVVVLDKVIIEGKLYAVVRTDETVWTLEDKKILHIVLSKADACSKETLWEGLLADDFLADPWTAQEMRKKLDLERFQIDNPGFDFSGAVLKKTYDKVPNSAIERWEEKQKALRAENPPQTCQVDDQTDQPEEQSVESEGS
ncbi:nudC domain-containing protein 2-like [Homarus americanus]|uniref:nudC domain-containing protein 2-like n=1 Tax=Homarus americanus TaxID=6706 RepID=UPI001C44075D|nr:nudC domain-containing protein 2-like [Homarus americanus]XP_042214104.1 nudC domain-containing protein 2-like [Homarus americanus]